MAVCDQKVCGSGEEAAEVVNSIAKDLQCHAKERGIYIVDHDSHIRLLAEGYLRSKPLKGFNSN